MLNRLILVAVATASVYAPATNAANPLGAESLKRYCSALQEAPESAEARLCLLYINGFVDGAVVTDERVTLNVVNEVERQESLLERAKRTRILGRLRDFGPSYYAEFCVGQAVSIAAVANQVTAEFDNYDSLEGVAAQAVVYSALQRHYPCMSKSA